MEQKQETSLEELFAQIEQTIDKMEEPEVSLEDSFRLYEEGIQKIRLCSDAIDRVEKKMLVLNESGELEEF